MSADIDTKLSDAKVSLLSKGNEEVQSQSTNAGYYIAGATLFSAAAVAFLIAKRKEESTVQQPLIALDDEFMASK